MKRNYYQIMLRLDQEDGLRIEDAAHAARLPTAIFSREILLGRVPKLAPPAPAGLSFGATLLIKISRGLISNLSQLEDHARRSGGVLDQLVGPDKALQKLSKMAQKLGLKIKATLIDEQSVKNILVLLEPAAADLNERLAKPLNEGKVLQPDVWRQILTALQAALPKDSDE